MRTVAVAIAAITFSMAAAAQGVPPDMQRVTDDRAAPPLSAVQASPLEKLFTSEVVVDAVPAKSYGLDKAGLFTIVLASGEIWTQQSSDTARAHWKAIPRPLIITIRQGSLGTYNLEVCGDKKRYEVRPHP